MTKQEGWHSARQAECANVLAFVMQFPCPSICHAVSLPWASVIQNPRPSGCLLFLATLHPIPLSNNTLASGWGKALRVTFLMLGSSPAGVPFTVRFGWGRNVTRAWPMGSSLPGFYVLRRGERDAGALTRLFAILWFIRNMYLVLWMIKIYFSDVFGLYPQFLAQSSWTPWNLLSVASDRGVFCYENEVTLRMGAGRQEKEPGNWEIGTFSPTPTSRVWKGAGDWLNRSPLVGDLINCDYVMKPL